jgi:signal transduction histidine kinase
MYSYPGAFSQIVTNLVLNSTLHAFEPNEEGNPSLALSQQADDKLWLIYADNGKGIPPRVFTSPLPSFFTITRHGGGTGLGLHIVYNIVTQNLQGSIRCESTLGEGTSFFLELPLTIRDSVLLGDNFSRITSPQLRRSC